MLAACTKPQGDLGKPVALSATTSAAPAPTAGGALTSPSVLAVVNPEHVPAYTGATGSLEGTIFVEGEPAPDLHLDFTGCPQSATTHGKQFREQASATDVSKRVLADAVVGITGYVGFSIPQTREAVTIIAKDCQLSARTVVMTFGQYIALKNGDLGDVKTYYAFELAQSPTPAMRVAAARSDEIRLYPIRPGADRLVEKMGRPFMSADVVVTLAPLYTVSALDGHYRIDGIPVGKLDAHAAHPTPHMRGVDKPIEIVQGAVTQLDFTIRHEGASSAVMSTTATAKSTATAPRASTSPSATPMKR
jgi:hypothetical protein